MNLKNTGKDIAVLQLIRDTSAFGGFPLYCFLSLVVLLLGYFELFFQLLIGFILAFGVTVLIRLCYFKERPKKQKFANWIEKIDASSFPSLHAMRATVLTVLLSLFFANRVVAVVFAILAVLVAVIRVQEKKHDIFDVIIGLVLGVILGFVSVWLVASF